MRIGPSSSCSEADKSCLDREVDPSLAAEEAREGTLEFGDVALGRERRVGEAMVVEEAGGMVLLAWVFLSGFCNLWQLHYS